MQDQIVSQANRVKGQVEGVVRMIEEQRDCLEVVQQILAARSALSRLGKEFLTTEAVKCANSAQNREHLDSLLKQLFTLE
jgi:DNA-binding FrmR family transcriptional regulator